MNHGWERWVAATLIGAGFVGWLSGDAILRGQPADPPRQEDEDRLTLDRSNEALRLPEQVNRLNLKNRFLVTFDVPAVFGTKLLTGRERQLAQQKIADRQQRLKNLVANFCTRFPKEQVSILRTFEKCLSGAAIENSSTAFLGELHASGFVASVEPDKMVTHHLYESAPQIGATTVRERLGVTGRGVVVAVIDTGIDYRLADLGAGFGSGFKVLGGYDFVNRDSDPLDDHGHGSHVAGIVAANGWAIGVAPEASLLAYKCLNQQGYGSALDIAAAIELSLDPDGDPNTRDAAQVLNLSLGGTGHPDDFLCRAINAATTAGVVCVVAAGNDSRWETVTSPAMASSALAVGAVSKQDVLASFSSRGPALSSGAVKPDLCAPGIDILSSRLGGRNTYKSGTSMAAPHVAGAAALLRQLHQDWTPSQIRGCLLSTSHDIGEPVMAQGAGRVDVLAACQAEVLIEGDLLGLGADTAAADTTWRIEKRLRLTSLVTTPLNLTTSIERAGLPVGVQVTVTPDTLTLPAGQTAELVFCLSADNVTVPELSELPFAYSGGVRLSSPTKTYRLPFAFTHEFRDRFEPNNTAAQAQPIVVDGSPRRVTRGGRTRIDRLEFQAGQLDEDWFQFAGRRDQVVTFTVNSGSYGSPLAADLWLYDSQMHEFADSMWLGDDARIGMFRLPADDTYYVRVAARRISSPDVPAMDVGEYHLFANSLPPEVTLNWTPSDPGYRNSVNQVRFSDGGQYVHSTRWYNFLTLSAAQDTGNPLYHVTRGAKSFQVSTSFGGSNVIHYDEPRYEVFHNAFLATSSQAPLSVTTYRRQRLRDTWAWSPGTSDWSDLTASATADWDTLDNPAVASDGRPFVFGGRNDFDGFQNRGWRWTGTRWESVTMTGAIPTPRRNAAMTWDADRRRFLLFGGELGFNNWSNELFEFDGNNWQLIAPASAQRPSAGYPGGFVYDPTRQVAVLYQGGSRETWEYAPASRQWTRRAESPTTLNSFGMCFDAARNRVLHLTQDPNDQYRFALRSWDGTAWTQLPSPEVPDGRHYTQSQITFDEQRRCVIVITSCAASPQQCDVWTWDGTDWKLATPNGSIPSRSIGFRVAWDTANQRMLLLSGYATGAFFEYPRVLEVRQTPNPTPVARLELGGTIPSEQIRGLAVAGDGSRIINSVTGAIQVRDAVGQIIRSVPWTESVDVVQTTSDGQLAVVEETERLEEQSVVDLNSGQELHRSPTRAHTRLSNNGNWLTQSYYGRTLSLFERVGATYQRRWRFDPGPNQAVRVAQASDDGSLVFAAGCRLAGPRGETGVLALVLDGRTGQERSRYFQPENRAIRGTNRILGLSLNSSGTLAAIATVGRDERYGQLMAFSPLCAAPLLELSVPGDVTSFDASGNRLAIGTWRHIGELAYGGETLAVDLSQRLQHVPPFVRDIRVSPPFADPGTPVCVTCRVEAQRTRTLGTITAEIEGPDEHPWTSLTLLDDGQHGDGTAGDGTFGAYWSTATTPRNYLIDLTAADTDGHVASHPNAAKFTTHPQPILRVESIVLEVGRTGLAPGINRFALQIRNHGRVTARDVVVTTAANDRHLRADTDGFLNQLTIPVVAPGQTVTTPFDFQIAIEPSIPQGHELGLNVELEDLDQLWSDTRRFPPYSSP